MSPKRSAMNHTQEADIYRSSLEAAHRQACFKELKPGFYKSRDEWDDALEECKEKAKILAARDLAALKSSSPDDHREEPE